MPKHLDAAQRKHQQLFCDHYKSLERPKAHFRLHLPRIYERLGYFDAFPAEAKHRLYKTFLADTHQGLWNEGVWESELTYLWPYVVDNSAAAQRFTVDPPTGVSNLFRRHGFVGDRVEGLLHQPCVSSGLAAF